jgi:hypothetical protein
VVDVVERAAIANGSAHQVQQAFRCHGETEIEGRPAPVISTTALVSSMVG